MKKISKHLLYELSVQSPKWQVNVLPEFHFTLTGRKPTQMREDFCGSGKISCEWVKASKKNKAVGLDIDDEVLEYAETVNRAAMTPDQKKRVSFLKQNVLRPTQQKFDFIGAYNFSYYIFQERKEMLKYARAAFASLKKSGTFFLEVAGGSDFFQPGLDPLMINVPGYGKVEQIWERHQFDPLTFVSDYSIHFGLPHGEWMNDAFTYHWRIWGVRELREILADAGFKKTVVLWEKTNRKGEATGEFVISEDAADSASWVAFVVGVK